MERAKAAAKNASGDGDDIPDEPIEASNWNLIHVTNIFKWNATSEKFDQGKSILQSFFSAFHHYTSPIIATTWLKGFKNLQDFSKSLKNQQRRV